MQTPDHDPAALRATRCGTVFGLLSLACFITGGLLMGLPAHEWLLFAPASVAGALGGRYLAAGALYPMFKSKDPTRTDEP